MITDSKSSIILKTNYKKNHYMPSFISLFSAQFCSITSIFLLYEMVIGSDLLWNMGDDISYSCECVKCLDDFILLKELNTLVDREMCEMLYLIHTDSPLIKEMEERVDQILDADYSKVDIPAMVNELDITEASKKKLITTLQKFPKLFGGGLGCLRNQKPATIKLKEGLKPHAGRYYNLPKEYHAPTKKEVERINGQDWYTTGATME